MALGLATAVRGGDFNPHFFHWPSLTIYTFAALQAVASAIRRAFNVDSGLTFADQMVVARAFVAGAGTLTLVVLFRMARRMANTTTGLLAAFFLAVSILHVRESHFAMTDALMTLLLTTSLAILLRAIDKDPTAHSAESRFDAIRWFAVAGFVGGLATSTKYSAAAVLAALGPRSCTGLSLRNAGLVAKDMATLCDLWNDFPLRLRRWPRPMRFSTSRHSRRTSVLTWRISRSVTESSSAADGNTI